MSKIKGSYQYLILFILYRNVFLLPQFQKCIWDVFYALLLMFSIIYVLLFLLGPVNFTFSALLNPCITIPGDQYALHLPSWIPLLKPTSPQTTLLGGQKRKSYNLLYRNYVILSVWLLITPIQISMFLFLSCMFCFHSYDLFLLSDLADLIEMIHKIVRLMENLQARGTLRVRVFFHAFVD